MCVYINVYVSTVHSSFAFLCNNIKLSAFRDRSLANPKLRQNWRRVMGFTLKMPLRIKEFDPEKEDWRDYAEQIE